MCLGGPRETEQPIIIRKRQHEQLHVIPYLSTNYNLFLSESLVSSQSGAQENLNNPISNFF